VRTGDAHEIGGAVPVGVVVGTGGARSWFGDYGKGGGGEGVGCDSGSRGVVSVVVVVECGRRRTRERRGDGGIGMDWKCVCRSN